ncbi:MAG: DUF4258 domain-containing protein [Anaerolineales bacterium]|nr:DUF4258 domain-containing protein [Anaerolineales bacterium]MDP2776602.1 DUF4258 domain-containing protein [Anaerolineales bacterium]
MTDYTFSKHALDMMEERNILENWVRRALNESDNTFTGDDGNLHFSKAIAEREDRVLHVVVNSAVSPKRIVTLFFDRRLRSKK